MLLDSLPTYPNPTKDRLLALKRYIMENMEGADFVFLFDEKNRLFLWTFRMDLILGLHNLSLDSWYRQIPGVFYKDWVYCIGVIAKEMLLNNEDDLLLRRAKYRISFPILGVKDAFLIQKEAQPIAIEDDEGVFFATINRCRLVARFSDFPYWVDPQLVDENNMPLERATDNLTARAKQLYCEKYWPLTRRQTEIAKILAKGVTNNVLIGEVLGGIKPNTIIKHRSSISQVAKDCFESPFIKNSEDMALYLQNIRFFE